jgi:hypothetical protein
MQLPNPGMDFTPFDTLPAASLDDLVENIEALATYPIERRQGGTTGDNSWATPGTSNTDTTGKDLSLQTGVINSSNAGAVSVTFPVAYSEVPIVFLTSLAAIGIANVESVSATGFTFSNYSTANVRNNNVATSWLAIGQ